MNRLRLLWITLCLCIWASTAWADVDRHLRRTAKRVVAHADELNELWPGYWPQDQGFVLYNGEGTRLVVVAKCEDYGLAAFDDYRHMEFCESSWAADVNLPKASMVEEGGYELPAAQQKFFAEQGIALVSLFLQRCHQFVRGWKFEVPNGEFSQLDLDAELMTEIHIEQQVLSRALEFTDSESRVKDLLLFMGVRIERNKTMSIAQVNYQNALELGSGFTNWATYRAAHVVLDESAIYTGEFFIQLLTRGIRNYEDISEHYLSDIPGISGAAMIELMKRQGFGFEAALQAGVSPFEILRYAYKDADIDSRSLLNAAASPDFREDTRRKAQQLLDGERNGDELYAQYQKQGRYWLTLYEVGQRRIEYDRFYRMDLEDNSTLFWGNAKSVVNAPSFNAEVNKQWQRHIPDSDREAYLSGMIELPLNEWPELQGCRSGAMLICLEGAVIRGNDFSINVEKELVIEQVGDHWYVYPLEGAEAHDRSLILYLEN